MLAQNIGQPTRHTRAEVYANWPQRQHDSRGHIFAGMLPRAFDHSQSPAIANGEAFARTAGNIKFAAGCTVQHSVSHEYVAAQGGFRSGGHHDPSAAHGLSHIVVGFAHQMEADIFGQESSKALASDAAEPADQLFAPPD